MIVHVGNFSELPSPFGDFIRVASRWALPFFFLCSGYLSGISHEFDVGKKINKLVSILFYASILYIPIMYRMLHGDFTSLLNKIISGDTLHGGTSFHLWFINALILGVVLTNYMLKNVSAKKSFFIAIGIIIACWASDVVKSLGYEIWVFYALRTMISFSLFYIGYIMAKGNLIHKISNKVAMFIFLFGVLLMVLEVYFLHAYAGADMHERQLPIMSVPVAIALLIIGVNSNIKEGIASRIGRDYSLGVYLIHPFLIYIAIHDVGSTIANNSSLKLILCFILSVSILWVLKNFIPVFYKKLNGIGVR
ncbi:hypothetical protein DT73_22975 [Mangrovibacter sp. MFB070]|nr:hypothetical protein DT73_22975 [Mangrovibacter sp. MFB070]